MNKNIWKWTFVASIGFNCVLALLLFTYEVLDMWGWNPLWIPPMTVLLLGWGLVLIWGWMLEHRGPGKEQAILRYTLTQDGVPLSHLVFILEPVDGWQIFDGQEGHTDEQSQQEWREMSEEHDDLFGDPASDRVTHPLQRAVSLREHGHARLWFQHVWESVHDCARHGAFWKTGRFDHMFPTGPLER